MNDMSKVIIPRSDQINADSLLAGPITITITNVDIKPGTEQPVTISYNGDDGKPWRPCKSMARILVAAWGPDSSKYIGRSLTLYCDPTVKWGGMAVGGLRISHMSDIDSAITMALTVTRANKKPYTVKPILSEPKTAAPQNDADKPTPSASEPPHSADAAATITAEEALKLESRCEENNVKLGVVKKFFNVTQLSQLTPEQLVEAHTMIDETLTKRKKEAANV